MANKNLTQMPLVDALSEDDTLLVESGNRMGRAKVKKLKGLLEGSDMWLQQVAFYIDINEPAGVSTNVNVGGNMNMRSMWEAQWRAGIMDANGNWAELSPENNRYGADGTLVVNPDGTVAEGLGHCDFMNLIPETYCYIQIIDMGESIIERLWLSLMPLPGWKEPRQLVGAFKATTVGGQLRSIPNAVPTRSKTVRNFWLDAQSRSKNHGLSGVYFRNMLLWYMMSKYGQRSSQTATLPDGTQIWGPGLDETGSETYTDQYTIVTGQTLHLGAQDGKVAVLDSKGATCHSVRVKNFENPWGQFWEDDGHMISFENEVWAWRANFMPSSSAPTKADFANVDCDKFTRHTATITSGERMNIITGDKPGVFMIPSGTRSGISYGDRFSYAAAGQLWLWGGYSNNGSDCGLAYSSSTNAWTHSYASIGARLAYFGDITEVDAKDLVA